jgi:hypothetical protein
MKPEDFVPQSAFDTIVNEDSKLFLLFGFKEGCDFKPEGFYSKNYGSKNPHNS